MKENMTMVLRGFGFLASLAILWAIGVVDPWTALSFCAVGALLGFGVMPAAAAGGTQLAAVTRRAIMPAVVVQTGQASPFTTALLSAAEPVTGGVSPITVPIQSQDMVTGAYTDYAGSFGAPQDIQGLLNAEYNLTALVIGIPYFMFEGLIQQDADIVPIAWARMNSAGNFASNLMSTKNWAALSANSALEPFSINDIIATTNPTQGNVGNIDRSANSYWRANTSTISTLTAAASTVWSRANTLAAIMFAQKSSGGEAPSCGLVSPGAWMAIAADTIGNERYIVDKEGTYADAGEGATVGFPAINIAGVPIYADPYQTTNTTLLLPNFNYLGSKIHADAAFAVAGPESLLPQFQLGFVMAMFVLHATICSKNAAQTSVTSYTGAYVI